MSNAEDAQAIRTHVARQRFTFELLEEPAATAPVTVLEKETGKQLSFALGAVTRVEEDRDVLRSSRYLRVWLDDGRAFALTAHGFVFAPSFASTGPLADCPPTASFADFQKLFHHLRHLVDEVEQGRQGEALQVILILIAFLDGARAIGLSVDEEERVLEAQLLRLEERGVSVR